MSGPKVALLDSGSGNLHSAARALQRAGAYVTVTAEAATIRRCERLVVPGVGAFSACMSALTSIGGDELIHDWVDGGRPLLGICVGHQILFEQGTEHSITTAGLGIVPGTVTKLAAQRLPHMGWNTVLAAPGSRIFAGIGQDRFYFVHSYAVAHTPAPGTSLTHHEGAQFVAAIEAGPVAATQFHPEKSGAAGTQLLANWLGQVIG
ncbi:MAG: imidazole glycerol phosphate synthase subunit HisH [Arachnia sp.]